MDSTTKIQPLPAELRGTKEWAENEMDARYERVRELKKANGDSLLALDAEGVAELKQLNDDFDRLVRFIDEGAFVMPYPEGWSWPGGSSSSRSGFGGTFYDAIVKAGWDPVTKSRVTVPAEAGLFKAVTVTGNIEDYYARGVAGTGLGADRRYLYPALRQVRVSASDTSVQYLNQTARALATPANMIRDIDAVTDKPESALTVELASADLKQVAHVVSGVPNIVARQRPFGDLIEGDLRLGLSEALDDMVDDAITAASVPMANAGTNIAEKIRSAAAEVEDAGYSPDTVALSPDEAVALDILSLTLNNSTSVSPLFGLRPRISKALSLAIVFDSRAFATLYAGPIEFSSHEENSGKTNTQLFRSELNAVAVIDREDAGCEVWGS